MKRGRGRHRGQRWISELPEKRWFAPEGADERTAVTLRFEELEAIRLVDLLELQQQEAAFYMGISRKAFWNDLKKARTKVATALVHGLGIKIEGGSYALREGVGPTTPAKPSNLSGNQLKNLNQSSEAIQRFAEEDEIAHLERETLLVGEKLEHLNSKIASLKRQDEKFRGKISADFVQKDE